MPDISMCKGEGCPLKEKCYRHMAKPDSHWQCFMEAVPYNKEKKSCDYFWGMEDL